LFLLTSCEKSTEIPNITLDNPSILYQLAHNYIQLPEKAISISADGNTYAQYAKQTSKYAHGILGDQIEAEQLIVVEDSIFYEFNLEEEYVYEDLRPRLFDVNLDGDLEFITIRSHQSFGAAIVIYEIEGGELKEYAFTEEIGNSNKWLNLVTINDLTNDGQIEMVWIQTPHIGGILKYAIIEKGELEVKDEVEQYSNHAIGERNLCLSVLTEMDDDKIFYVPNQGRTKIAGFEITDSGFQMVDEIELNVDFSIRLTDQYNFTGVLEEEENNCVFVE